jgi:hypothetical protein
MREHRLSRRKIKECIPMMFQQREVKITRGLISIAFESW